VKAASTAKVLESSTLQLSEAARQTDHAKHFTLCF
jgi:hypothetical protein